MTSHHALAMEIFRARPTTYQTIVEAVEAARAALPDREPATVQSVGGFLYWAGRTHCVWTDPETQGIASSGCGQSYWYAATAPREDGFLFCPYCGREIVYTGAADEPAGEKP